MISGTGNDLESILNLACIKYTGFPLPTSALTRNNWKYEWGQPPANFFEGGEHGWKYAKWSPDPYFNPLHLHYPANDLVHQIQRKHINEELRFYAGDLHKDWRGQRQYPAAKAMADAVKKLLPYTLPSDSVSVSITLSDRQRRISSILCESRTLGWVRHADERIMRNKVYREGWSPFENVLTAKGTIRKNPEAIIKVYIIRMIQVCCSMYDETAYIVEPPPKDFPQLPLSHRLTYFNCGCKYEHPPPAALRIHDQKSWSWMNEGYNVEWATWRSGRRTAWDVIKNSDAVQGDRLEPEDYVRIFNRESINIEKLLEKKITDNFVAG